MSGEEDEEDSWIKEDIKKSSVSLLKPQVVKFVVQPSNTESAAQFSKTILPEEIEE